MSLTFDTKKEIVRKYGKTENDTGSSEVQIALLTADIADLTEHFKIHKKDNHSRRGLIRKVNLRRKHLNYLKMKDMGRYRNIVQLLKLRG